MVCYTVTNNEITLSGIWGLTNETDAPTHTLHSEYFWGQHNTRGNVWLCNQMVTKRLPFTEGTHWEGFIPLPLVMSWLFWEPDKGSPLGIPCEGAGVAHWLGRDYGTPRPRHSYVSRGVLQLQLRCTSGPPTAHRHPTPQAQADWQ